MATYEQLMDAADKADSLGLEDDARRLIEMALEVQSASQPSELPPTPELYRPENAHLFPNTGAPAQQFDVLDPVQGDPTPMTSIVDNIVGIENDTLTPGERLGQLVRGGTAAISRGMADLPALPANLAQIATYGAEKALGMDGSTVGRALDNLPDTRDMLASVPVIGPESRYKAPGKAGDWLSTIGEFAGGAGLAAGPGAMVRYGALPGGASEAAGQLTKGTNLEPWARTAAALGAGVAATRAPTKFGRGASRAFGKMDKEAKSAAEYLARKGVAPTAGQAADSPALMRMEGTLTATSRQTEQLTRAALRMAGNKNAVRASPNVLKETQKTIGAAMDTILDVDVPITTTMGARALDVADDFFLSTAGKNLPVTLRKISEKLTDMATRPGKVVIPATRLREWRTSLGHYAISRDEATRDAAHALRGVIDDATEATLRTAGRADDIAKLAKLREQYRNLLIIADATTRGGREAARGWLSPARLDSAAKRIIKRNPYAFGQGTELSDFARKSVGVLGDAPTVLPGGLRNILTSGTTSAGLGGGGAYLGYQAGGPVGGIIGGAAGVVAPHIGRAGMRSGLMQSLLSDPMNIPRSIAPAIPGVLSEERGLIPKLLRQ